LVHLFIIYALKQPKIMRCTSVASRHARFKEKETKADQDYAG